MRLFLLLQLHERRPDPALVERARHFFDTAEYFRVAERDGTLTGFLKGHHPGPDGSIFKLYWSEYHLKVTELAVEAVGWYGTPFTELRNYDSNIVPVGGEYVDDVSPRYFNTRKTTIYGGSSEVQRNVLAKAMLGL